jgi:hypothetical protein
MISPDEGLDPRIVAITFRCIVAFAVNVSNATSVNPNERNRASIQEVIASRLG